MSSANQIHHHAARLQHSEARLVFKILFYFMFSTGFSNRRIQQARKRHEIVPEKFNFEARSLSQGLT